MKKSYLWVMAVIGMAIALAGCSKDNDNGIDTPTPQEEQVEIMAKSKALTLNVTTKAPFEGTIDTDNNLTARVLVSTTADDYETLHANGTMTFANQTGEKGFNTGESDGFSGNKFFPGNDDIYLVGLYPVSGWGSIGETATYTIDGKSDVMYAPQVETDKNAAKASTPSYPVLAFTHLLTKLEVYAVATNQATSDAWGKITDLSLTKVGDGTGDPDEDVAVSTVATVTFETGAAAFGTDGSIYFYTANDDKIEGLGGEDKEDPIAIPVDEDGDGEKVAYSLVTPVDIDASTTKARAYILSITTTASGGAIDVPITLESNADVDTGDTAGFSFAVTLTFTGTEIKAKASVAPWVTGGTGSGTIE